MKVVEGPKYKPQFLNFESVLVLNVAEFLDGTRTRYEYKIPDTFDSNKWDKVNVTVKEVKQSFIQVDYE